MTPKSLFRKSCMPCRQRHLKCDQTKPKYTNCQKSRHGVQCFCETKGFRFQRCVVSSEITNNEEQGLEKVSAEGTGQPTENCQSPLGARAPDRNKHERNQDDSRTGIEEDTATRPESSSRRSPSVSADTGQASYSSNISDDIASEHDLVIQPEVCQDLSPVYLPSRPNLPGCGRLSGLGVSEFPQTNHVNQISLTSEVFPGPSNLPLTPSSSLGSSGIIDSTEAFILSYYLENAGPWLDIVSPTRFFGIHVPQLMIGEPDLLSACLAYSSLVLHLHRQVSIQVKDELYNRALR